MSIFLRIKQIAAHQGFRRYLANTSWLMGEKILRAIAGVFVGIYVARYLGPQNFGIYSYALAFATLFGVLAKLGLDGVILRQLINHPGERGQYLGTAFWMKLGGALATLGVIAAILPLTSNDDRTNLYILIITSGLVFQSFEVINFYFESKVQTKYGSVSQMVQLAVSSVFKLVFVFTGADLVWLVLIGALDHLLIAVTLVKISSRKQLPFFYAKFSMDKARSMLGDAWPFIFSGFAIMLCMRVDQIMIKEMLGEGEVGVYSAAVRLSEAWHFVPAVIAASLFPAILNARNISDALYYERLQRLLTLIVWITVAVALLVTVFAGRIVMLLYGAPYQEAGIILAIHIWAMVFVGMAGVSGKWLLAENFAIFALTRVMAGGTLNVLLNLRLIPHLGPAGAAVATLATQFVTGYAMDLMNYKTRKVFKMKTRALFLKGVLW